MDLPGVHADLPRDRVAPSPLTRMRRYTTLSFSGLVGLMAVVAALVVGLGSGSPAPAAATLVVGGVVTALSWSWEHGPSRALIAVALLFSWAFWWLTLAAWSEAGSWAAVLFAVAVAVVATTPPAGAPFGTPPRGWPWVVGGALAVAAPPVLLGLGGLLASATVVPLASSAVVFVVAAWAAYRLNRYQFGLYLEIDAARETEAELAVLRERYRFSTDLHDIQGQTLHVSRLQLQLAEKTLDRDVEVARRHLHEAEQLIAQTIAETRRLAYGERTVTLAGELANSAELMRAAGIELVVVGEAPPTQPLDDLLGLVVREATTNLLRHAQAEHVAIELGPGRVAVVNDGAVDHGRRLSGLARLGDRFAEAGGVLATDQRDGTFRTEARTASSGALGAATPGALGAPRAGTAQEARVGSTARTGGGAAGS